MRLPSLLQTIKRSSMSIPATSVKFVLAGRGVLPATRGLYRTFPVVGNPPRETSRMPTALQLQVMGHPPRRTRMAIAFGASDVIEHPIPDDAAANYDDMALLRPPPTGRRLRAADDSPRPTGLLRLAPRLLLAHWPRRLAAHWPPTTGAECSSPAAGHFLPLLAAGSWPWPTGFDGLVLLWDTGAPSCSGPS